MRDQRLGQESPKNPARRPMSPLQGSVIVLHLLPGASPRAEICEPFGAGQGQGQGRQGFQISDLRFQIRRPVAC